MILVIRIRYQRLNRTSDERVLSPKNGHVCLYSFGGVDVNRLPTDSQISRSEESRAKRGNIHAEKRIAGAIKDAVLSVSVIVPVHNGGENFRVCLESLKESHLPPTEIIVVADG